MWIALIFVLYVDGTPYVEADIASDRATCEEMRNEFNDYVRSDTTVAEARFNCIRVPVRK